MSSLITLTTDFGTGSPYVAQMKGVILSINPAAVIVDVTHAVPPQDVRAGALALAEATVHFPADSTHVAVVDPGVGTDRKILFARIGEQNYIAPDNGLLSGLARRERPSTIIAVTEPRYWADRVAPTFHGRDIMAHVAAHASRGVAPQLFGQSFGPPLAEIVELEWPEVRIVPGKIEGSVVSIDSFGNLVTDITAENLADAPRGSETHIRCGDHETFGIFNTYEEQPAMTLIALVGSSDQLELAIVGDSAKIMLGVAVGEKVSVSW